MHVQMVNVYWSVDAQPSARISSEHVDGTNHSQLCGIVDAVIVAR